MSNTASVDTDTIAAVATPPGLGGIGIVRVSGPRASEIGQAVAGRGLVAGRVHVTLFRNLKGEPVDQGVALFFAGPRSFTGEDVLELQGHGGPVVMQLLLEAVLQGGARLARPGEFSERAFANGKLDLAQAEAVADLIASASRAAARGAMRSLQGEFSKVVHEIDARLLHLRMYVEAAIDFPEEEVDFLVEGQIAEQLGDVQTSVAHLLAQSRVGRLMGSGISVALVGAPNVGKSSLLNRLAGEERAIVTDIPGTTRDLIKADLIIDGLPVQIVDTAGLRESLDPVEQEGVRRALEQAAQADVILLVSDVPDGSAELFRSVRTRAEQSGGGHILQVRNKIDLLDAGAGTGSARDGQPPLGVSAHTGAGLETLRRAIKECVGYSGDGAPFTARQRHVEALEAAQRALLQARELIEVKFPGELVAEELKVAHRALGSIVGELTPDALLGEIFASFCIGK